MMILVEFYMPSFHWVTVETTLFERHSSMAQLSRFIQSLNNPEFSSSPLTTKTCFNRSEIEMKFCVASLAADKEQECGRVKTKKLRGVHVCQRSSNLIFSFSTFVFPHFFLMQRWPTVWDYIPFYPSSGSLSALHLLFLPPLPQSCVSLPFASTSLPLFSLTLKSSQSLCFPSFTASTCWQEEKEEDAALTPQCCRATPPVSADCLWLQLSSQLSLLEGLWRGGAAGSVGGSGELAAWSSTGITTAGEWSGATVLLWWKLPTSQQWPSPLPPPVSLSPLPPFQLPDPCGRKQ